MQNSDTIKEILEKMGYKPRSEGREYRIRPLYRQSDTFSVSVNASTGMWIDYVTGQNGGLADLGKLTLGLDDKNVKEFLMGAYYEQVERVEEPKLKQEKTFSKDFLDDLLPSYSFYNKRGISTETLKLFEGAVKSYGKLNNRFCFPAYDFKKNLIGICGRCLYPNTSRCKWKILGRKSNFCYPWHLTEKSIEETGECILIEGISDALALYEAGIKNFLVLFGLNLSKVITLYLIRLGVSKVVIATNNDENSAENPGLSGATKIKEKLERFFRPESVEIRLPIGFNDFGEMNKNQIQKWYNKEDQPVYPKLQ